MSAPADDNVNTLVITRGPGLVYIKILDPMPRHDRIEPLLRQRIDHWFGSHPRFAIDRSEAVVENGSLRGMLVWYHEIDLEVQPTTGQPPAGPTSMTIEIHSTIAQQFPREYIEAVLDQAMQISYQLRDRQDTLVVVNPRRGCCARQAGAAGTRDPR